MGLRLGTGQRWEAEAEEEEREGERVGSLLKVTVELGSHQEAGGSADCSLTHLLFQPQATEARQWARWPWVDMRGRRPEFESWLGH